LVHIQRKRPIEAMRSLNAALQYRPGFGAVLLNQAIVAQQYFGNKQVALERYKAYLGTKPPPHSAAAVQVAIREIETPVPDSPSPVTLADLTTNTGISDLLRSNLAQQDERSRAEAAHLTSAVAQAAVNLKTNLAAQQPPPRRDTSPPPVIAAAPIKTNTLPPPDKQPEVAGPVQLVEVNKEPEFRVARELDSQPVVSQEQQLAMNKAGEEKPLIAPRKRTEDEKHGILSRIKQANPARWFDRDEPKTVPIPAPKTIPPSEQSQLAPRVAPPPVRPPPIARYEYGKNLNLSKGNRAQAQKLFTQAASLHQQRRLPEAIALYRQALNADPSYFEVCFNLGLAAFQNKDLPLALSANEQAVALRPNSVDARYNFAFTLREARYYVDAANELRELLNRSPNDSRAHLALANLYSQQLDEPALARTHYQRFLELSPNHPDGPAVRNLLMLSR
jgi:tetratricopeptide (TPR) repeat protein